MHSSISFEIVKIQYDFISAQNEPCISCRPNHWVQRKKNTNSAQNIDANKSDYYCCFSDTYSKRRDFTVASASLASLSPAKSRLFIKFHVSCSQWNDQTEMVLMRIVLACLTSAETLGFDRIQVKKLLIFVFSFWSDRIWKCDNVSMVYHNYFVLFVSSR